MKVLWFSNCELGNNVSKGSGSWLFAMCRIICNSVELINATLSNVDQVVYNKYDTFSEVLIPKFKLKDGIPEEKNTKVIQEVIETINPDIIHIWGIEGFWGLLYAKGFIKGRVILEIQGLMGPCYESFWGGINPKMFALRSRCLREFLYSGSRLYKNRKVFMERSKQSEYVLSTCRAVSTQSRWVRNQIKFVIGEGCKVYNTLRPIRQEFWDAEQWKSHDNSYKIFTSLSYYMPFKGLHILIKALSLLKHNHNNVVLEIAGIEKKDLIWYRQFPYIKYLIKLAKKLDVYNNISFVGRLNASEIVKHLRESDVFVNPSFVESYSATTAEAMAVGIPIVAAYAGAMPDFSANQAVALYYSPMDYVDCAAKITVMMENSTIRNELILNSKNEIKNICGSDRVREAQLGIYYDMMKEE